MSPRERSSQERMPDDRNSPRKYSALRHSLIWFAFLALLFYFLGGFQSEDRVSVPYSVFKQQVVAGNVREVTFNNRQIRGQFIRAYRSGGTQNENAPGSIYFKTAVPSVNDPSLLALLEKQGVTITAEPEGSPWLIYGLLTFLPWLLLIGYLVYVGNRMQSQVNNSANGGGIFGFGKSKAKRYRKTAEEMHFSDVAGMEKVKRDLQEIVDYLKDPQRFTKLGAEIPKGVLLMGAPGTGKTMLAKAVAGEVGVPFFSISGSEFVEMFVGVGASRVRDMFSNAKKNAPSIIFIDEIDSIGRTRGTGIGGAHDEREQTLNQILSEMDGFQPHEAVVVMAATNRPDVLDPALTRPGRFDRQIVIDLPQKQARLGILKIHTRKVPLASTIDLENIAARTVGFSGAVIKNIVNEAALLAGRKNKKQVEQEDFDQALDKVMLGMEHEEKVVERERRLIAYHETGHALVAKLVPGADPLQKVTIIPRGRSLGATEQVPEIDRSNLSRSYLESLIAVRLGGHVAEKLVFNDLTNGGADDLKQATRIARLMVSQWGMSDRLGPVTFQAGEEHVFLGREMTQPKDFSEHTARIIDEEIGRLVRGIEEQVWDLLQKNRSKLDALADALIERETLNNKDVDAIIQGQ